MRIGDFFFTLLGRVLLGLVMLVYFIPFLIILCIPKKYLYDSKLFFWFTHSFYWLVITFSFVPLTIIGKENIPDEPCIVVANHQSSLDIPYVGYFLKVYPHVWLAKSDLMESPILRFVVPRIAILVDMSTPQKGMRSLVQALKHIKEKNRHVVIFPEGGRYVDGKVHEFFPGFVILARKTERPVVPIVIFGLNKVYPPDSFLAHRSPVKITVGKPMRFKEGETDQEFLDRVYQWFLKQQVFEEQEK